MPALYELPTNAVFRSSEPSGRFIEPHRVLYCDRDSDSALLFCMSERHRRPRRFILHELVDDWAAGRIIQVDFPLPSIMLLSDDQIRPDYKKSRDNWWVQFEPLLGGTNLYLLYEDFPTVIKQFSEETGIQLKTIYMRAYRFFYYGCMPNAFLPRFDLRGGPGKTRIYGSGKTGRPRKAVLLGHDEENIGINVTEEDKAHFINALEKWWAGGEQYTFKKTYKELCKESYTDNKEDCVKVHRDKPTYRQFVHHTKLFAEFPRLLRERVGAKKFLISAEVKPVAQQ